MFLFLAHMKIKTQQKQNKDQQREGLTASNDKTCFHLFQY